MPTRMPYRPATTVCVAVLVGALSILSLGVPGSSIR